VKIFRKLISFLRNRFTLVELVLNKNGFKATLVDLYKFYEKSHGHRRWPVKGFFGYLFPFLVSHKKQSKFLHLILGMMSELAGADGEFSSEEKVGIEQFLSNELHLGEKERREAFKILKEVRNSPMSFNSYAKEYYWTFRSNRGMLESAIDLLLSIGHIDGHFDVEEKRLIAQAAKQFRIKKTHFLRIQKNWRFRQRKLREWEEGHREDDEKTETSHAKESPLDYYRVLGCKPGDSLRKVKAHYRKLTKKYNPDSLQAGGMSEGFIKRSERKLKSIQNAYSEVMKDLGHEYNR